jgi:hypothetical protein
MERRSKAASENGLTREDREKLERIVVRLLDVAARCGNPDIQYELMRLAEDLVKLIED